MRGSPAIFIMFGVFERTNKVLGQDLSRFVYIVVGTAAEKLLLQGLSLGRGSTLHDEV